MPSPPPAPLPAPLPEPAPARPQQIAAPAPTVVIPVASDEQLVATMAVLDDSGPAPLTIEHLGMVLVGYAIGVDLAWTGRTSDGVVDVELTGPGVNETQTVRLQQSQRVIFKARPRTEGDYMVRVRAGGGERTRVIRVTSNGMLANTPHRELDGAYRLVARGIVRGKFGGVETVVHRGRFDRSAGDATLVVDVSTDISDPSAMPKLVAALGKPMQLAGHTIYQKPADRRHEVAWLSRRGASIPTTILRVDAAALTDSELRVIESYLAMYPPLPAPLQITPGAPKRCTADAQHCCLPDGRVIRFEGCQPIYREAPGAFVRGSNGFCQAIECHLRCLPADARIATPAGDMLVSRLRPGDHVWTTSAIGERVAAPIRRISSIPVIGSHVILEITLDDGRVVRASAGHPADARTFGELRVGGPFDGAIVTSIRTLPYAGATWDLLPDSPTGAYWSDGVLIGSTLHP
jgi:hypothetical protein